MDGGTDGSSIAAQSARPEDAKDGNARGDRARFLDWVWRRRGRRAADAGSHGDPMQAAEQSRLLINLRNMRNMRVDDVAIPRADIVAVPVDSNREALHEVFRNSGLSRIPVYDESPDAPLGILHLKDVALDPKFHTKGAGFSLKDHLRPLLYVPPSMAIGTLLQKMQNERMHMALVIDEYGGVDGLVTMEDLVEQIVGEIADEHDADEDKMWAEEGPGIYRTLARADLEDFERAAGVDLLPDDLAEDVDTLGGLVFMLAGHVPARGEVVRHPQGHEFEVLDADPRKIKRLRVRLTSALAMDRAAE